MNWRGQVWHIMRKDVRQHRMPVALHLAALIVATVTTIVVGATPLMWLLPFTTACLATAFIVQGDPLSVRAAHWATQPLHASALVAAKLLIVGAVVVIPALLAQWLALRASGAGLGRSFELLRPSVWFIAFTVLVVMTWALITVRLSTFVLQAFLLYALMLGASRFGPIIWGNPDAQIRDLLLAPWATSLLVAGAAVLAMTAWYRWRMTGWRSWIGGNALVVVCMTACANVMDPSPTAADVGPALGPQVVLRAEVLGSGRGLQLRCHVTGARPNERVRIDYDSVTVTFGSGSLRRFRTGPLDQPPRRYFRDVLDPYPIQDSALRWLGESRLRSGCDDRVTMDAPAHEIASGVRQVVMAGTMEVFELAPSDTVPLQPGVMAEVGPGMVRFDSAQVNPLRLFFNLRVLLGSGRFFSAAERHALINPVRSEAVLLPGYSSASGSSLVLPGAMLLTGTTSLAAAFGHGEPRLDAAWLADAYVVLVRRTPIGRSPYVATAVPE